MRCDGSFPGLLLAAVLAASLSPAAFAGAANPTAEASAPAAPPANGQASGDPGKSGKRSAMPKGVIRLDETVISGNQELPKVLYIVPWQQPQGLPEIELDTDFTEAELFRPLYPPAYRRELDYSGAEASQTSDSKE